MTATDFLPTGSHIGMPFMSEIPYLNKDLL